MIKIKNLHKSIKKARILKDLSLDILDGRITAILGPNGSGKTTLLKIILGLMKYDSGEVSVNGINIKSDITYKSLIGYMPQIARYPENLKVGEVIKMIKDIRGIPTSHSERSEESCAVRSTGFFTPLRSVQNDARYYDRDLYARFGLLNELNKPFKALSGGTKQKLSAVLAFMFNPEILILDEPTAGLDPVSCSILKDKIQDEKERGKTIILTSHIMSDIEELADDLIILLDGEILFNGELEFLLEITEETKLEKAIIQLLLAVGKSFRNLKLQIVN